MSPTATLLCAYVILAFSMPAAAQSLRPWQERPERRELRYREQRAFRSVSIGRSGLFEIGDACRSTFDGAEREQLCVATVVAARVRYSPAPLIRACASAFSGDDAEMACVQTALVSHAEPSASVAACDRAFVGDENALRCIERVAATASRGGAVGVEAIIACDRAFSGDDNALACLEALPCGPYDPAEFVAYCDQQSAGDLAALSCLQSFR